MVAAISSGVPRRFIGISDRKRRSASLPAGVLSRNISVSIGPGATALTVMPVSRVPTPTRASDLPSSTFDAA